MIFGRRTPVPPRLRVWKIGTNSWSMPWAWRIKVGDKFLCADVARTHAQALAVGLAALEHATAQAAR